VSGRGIRLGTPSILGPASLGLLLLLTNGSRCVPTATPPEGMGATEGPIVQRDRPTSFSDGRPTIHVRRDDDECGVIFVIDHRTDIMRVGTDDTRSRGSVEDLVVGRVVRAYSTVIMKSCPAQATALAVEVLGG
jgi:hypothetical protein